jgi:hypothetical protein
VDSLLVPGWIYYLLETLISSESIRLSIIVAKKSAGAPRVRGGPLLFQLWASFDRWLRRSQTDALEIRDLGSLLHAQDGVSVLSLSSAAISQTLRLDLLLQLGGGRLPSGIANRASRVWCLNREEETNSSIPLQLRDIDEGNPVMVHGPRLIERTGLVCRTVFRAAGITSFLSMALNQNEAWWSIASYLASAISNPASLRSDETTLEIPSRTPKSPRARVKSFGNLFMAGFTVRWIARVAGHELRKRFLREQWSIVLRARNDISNAANPNGFRVLKPPRDRFYADPFLVERDGNTYMFFEDYRYASQKGVISCCRVDSSGNLKSEPRVALECDYHLSYPFLFSWNGEIYLMPETRDNATVELYQAVEFPYLWRRAAVLMHDVRATDTTLLNFGGKWWMFTAGMLAHASPNYTLFLFYADSPLGPWLPHPMNPIVRDARRARPAGSLYFENGKLIRPGQDCTRSYGYAIELQRVDVLTETDYRETHIGRITSDWIPGSRGTHTFNQNKSLQVLDGKFTIPRFSIESFTRRPPELRSFGGVRRWIEHTLKLGLL